jgi:hypothetical protein
VTRKLSWGDRERERERETDRVSRLESGDFLWRPVKTAVAGSWGGASFDLTAADKEAAMQADGSIKLRMVVHLYLPE